MSQTLSNQQTLFLLFNNSGALISPSSSVVSPTPLKIPLLTVWRAKCSDAIPYMTSIKRFHSPEAQNNPEKLSRRRESLYPHFVMNANYQGNRSAPQTGCYLFSYHLEIIVKFSLTGHWEDWSACSEFGLASFE